MTREMNPELSQLKCTDLKQEKKKSLKTFKILKKSNILKMRKCFGKECTLVWHGMLIFKMNTKTLL